MMIASIAFLSAPLLAHAPPPDNAPPVIGTAVFSPSSPSATDSVTVLVNVTDDRSVNNVTVVYTTDNWHSVNTTLLATYNATTTTATAIIPPLFAGGHVSFYIVAFDNAGKRAASNTSGSYYSYNVASPPISATTSTWIVYGALAAVLAGVAAFAFKILRKGYQPGTQTHNAAR